MLQFLTSAVGRLRLIAFIEGMSYLTLLFIAMPLKYLYDHPEAVRSVGMVHGLLFVAYIFLVFQAKADRSWNAEKTSNLLLISLIPFGNFYADRKWLAQEQA